MFVLDSRLEQDTLLLGDFPLCRLLLMNDSQYPWFILVPRREELSELFQLGAADQLALWKETTALAETVKDTFGADKMNVATLGNVVGQLHMHVIARRRDDATLRAVGGTATVDAKVSGREAEIERRGAGDGSWDAEGAWCDRQSRDERRCGHRAWAGDDRRCR